MSIYQNSNGKFGVDYRDAHGRRHRQQAGTREQAELIERKLRDSAQQSKHLLRLLPSLTIPDAFQLFHATQPTSAETKRVEAMQMQAFQKQLPTTSIANLDTRDLITWAEGLKDHYAPNTIAKSIGLMKRFFAWLEAANLGPNLAKPLRPPKRTLGTSHILSYAEEAAILAATHSQRLTLRTLLGLDAGLGISDASQLRRNQCDVISGLISHVRHKTQVAVKIPMTKRLRNLINSDFGQLAPSALLTTGKQLRAPADFLRDLRKRADVDFNFHDLRRTFATRLAETETNPIVITALLGHTTPWQTQLAYVKPTEQLLRAAIKRMENRNPNCKDTEEPCNTNSQHSQPSSSPVTSSPKPSDAPTDKKCWHCQGEVNCTCIVCSENGNKCIVCQKERKP